MDWPYQPVSPLISINLYKQICLLSTVASATRSLVYGQAPLAQGDDDDIQVKWLNDAMHAVLRASLPGAHLVDLLPVLKYLPLCLAPWKRKALAFYAENSRRFNTFMKPIRDPSASGSPSIAQNILQNQQRYNLTDAHVDWLAATLLQVTFVDASCLWLTQYT